MRLLIHNQRLDDNNRNEVIKSLHKRLELIVDQLANNYSEYGGKNKDEVSEGYL
jgi:predicted lactoylglutathione lyase